MRLSKYLFENIMGWKIVGNFDPKIKKSVIIVGVSLDRTPGQKKVEAIAEIFNQKEEFRLAMAPEGTRQKVEAWKTGFYYIAQIAKVPIICVAFDYKTKSVIVHEPFYPTGNLIPDLEVLSEKFAGVVGKKPALS